MEHQIKKSGLLDADRKNFYNNAEETKRKNNEIIDQLKKENRDLKKLQDELIANKRVFIYIYDRVQAPLLPKHKEHSSHGLETLRMRIIGDVNWMMLNTSPKLKKRDSYNCRTS